MTTYFSSVNRMTGLASGMDIDQMVQDLMRAARAPLDRLLQQKQVLEWQQADYRSINQSLYDLRNNCVFDMSLQKTYRIYKALSGNEAVVTAAAGASAQAGTYSITVHSLAEIASDVSSGAISSDPGNKIDITQTIDSQAAKLSVAPAGTTHEFTITTYNPDGTQVTESFTVDTTADSLEDVIARINAKSTTLGVTAFYEESTDKVVISTTRTGDYDTPEITITDTGGNFALGVLQLAATAEGKNAELDINGLTNVQQHENTFSLNGVTFNLKGTSANPVMVTVNHDTDAVVEMVKGFVEQYNASLDKIYGELYEERYPDYSPLTDAQKEEMSEREIELWEEKAKSGLLKADPILIDTAYRMRNAITKQIDGLDSEMNSIFDLGITTKSYWEGGNGQLVVDEAKLREKIAADPEAVMNLFTHQSDVYEEQGLCTRLSDTLQTAIDRLSDHAGTSTALYDQSYISRSIRDLEERVETTEERLTQVEERYWRQFTAMEQYLSQMNAQAAWLSQQFNAYGG